MNMSCMQHLCPIDSYKFGMPNDEGTFMHPKKQQKIHSPSFVIHIALWGAMLVDSIITPLGQKHSQAWNRAKVWIRFEALLHSRLQGRWILKRTVNRKDTARAVSPLQLSQLGLLYQGQYLTSLASAKLANTATEQPPPQSLTVRSNTCFVTSSAYDSQVDTGEGMKPSTLNETSWWLVRQIKLVRGVFIIFTLGESS